MSKNTDSSLLDTVSIAANNAAIAAKNASESARSAADNAQIAAKAAAESATAIAVVATDTSWMKGALTRVETTLNEMQRSYVTATQHADVLKNIDDHEIRINALEDKNTRQAVMLVIGEGILGVLVSILIYHVFTQ